MQKYQFLKADIKPWLKYMFSKKYGIPTTYVDTTLNTNTNNTLTTVRGKIKNFKLCGNLEQSTLILPNDYTQVDYIESDGNQYIDLGITANQDTNFSIKFETPSEVIGSKSLFGYFNDNTNSFYLYISSNKQFQFGYKSWQNFGLSNSVLENTIYNVSNNKNKLYVNGTEYTNSNTDDFSTSPNNLLLFKISGATSGGHPIKLYSFKLFNNKTIVRDMIPCYRNSDNEVGLYDIVNNVFYTNQGTGAFTYGSVASIPNPDYPQDIYSVSGDNNIIVNNKNFLDNTPNSQGSDISVWNYLKKGVYYVKRFKLSTQSSDVFNSRMAYKDKNNNAIPIIQNTILDDGNIEITGTDFGWYSSLATATLTLKKDYYIRCSGMLYCNMIASKTNDITSYVPHQEQEYTINLGVTLPSRYTLVDYIESTGTQYIDTTYVPTNLTKWEMSAQFTELTDINQFNGRYDGTVLPSGQRFDIALGSQYFILNGGDQTITTYPSDTNKHTFIVDMAKRKSYIDNNAYNISTHIFNSQRSVYLFARQANTVEYKSKEKIYYCKFYEDNILKMYLIPCYRNSDNEVGLYDLISNTFFTNQGTGVFTYGSIISNGIELCKIGDYQDYIRKSTGKSLFGGFTFSKTSSGIVYNYYTNGTILANGTSTSTSYSMFSSDASSYVKTLVAGTYTISGGTNIINVEAVRINGSLITTDTGNGATFTLEESTDVFIRTKIASGTTVNNVLVKPMLEKGSIATEYEPYTNNIPKWYKYGAIGKVVLDGSETWTYQSDVNSFYTEEDSILRTDDYRNIMLSNYYKVIRKHTSVGDYSISGYEGTKYLNQNWIYIRNIDFATATELKNWLSTHNVEVRYVLAIPEIIEITDSNLISQLDAIENSMCSYKDQTNITVETNINTTFDLSYKTIDS